MRVGQVQPATAPAALTAGCAALHPTLYGASLVKRFFLRGIGIELSWWVPGEAEAGSAGEQPAEE